MGFRNSFLRILGKNLSLLVKNMEDFRKII